MIESLLISNKTTNIMDFIQLRVEEPLIFWT